MREYNRERQQFDHFAAQYDDFKAGALALLESLEKGPWLACASGSAQRPQIDPSGVLSSLRRSRSWTAFARLLRA